MNEDDYGKFKPERVKNINKLLQLHSATFVPASQIICVLFSSLVSLEIVKMKTSVSDACIHHILFCDYKETYHHWNFTPSSFDLVDPYCFSDLIYFPHDVLYIPLAHLSMTD